MPTDKLQIFVAPGCDTCTEIKDALANGEIKVEGVDVKPSDIELVDLSSDDGYPHIDQLGISRVPAAYYKAKQCDLLVDEATKKITVICQDGDKEEEDAEPS